MNGALTSAATSASESPKFLCELTDFIISAFLSLSFLLSPVDRKILPSLFKEIITTFVSGATFAATELGVFTGTASEGLNFVVRIKNDSSRKATSHIAVMSTAVLFRGIFGLAIC